MASGARLIFNELVSLVFWSNGKKLQQQQKKKTKKKNEERDRLSTINNRHMDGWTK